MTSEELLKKPDLEKVAIEGSRIYEEIKSAYEPNDIGKFLAIDIESKDVYVSITSADAVAQARKAHPNKIFYVVKIGFDAAETLANTIAIK